VSRSLPGSANQGEKRVPLVAHIIYRLAIGGMENGLVNLINHIPEDRYRHAIICLTDHTAFRERIRNRNVQLFALYKREGKDFSLYPRIWKLLRQLRPDIVHTRNLATVEHQFSAFLAGCHARVHGEHGWNVGDLDGNSTRNRLIRKACRPFVKRYIAVSGHIERYLEGQIGVPRSRTVRVFNGVDTTVFRPTVGGRRALPATNFPTRGSLVIGTVGRMEAVKDQATLVMGFSELLQRLPREFPRPRLVIVGDGPLAGKIGDLVASIGLADLVWMPGARDDIPAILQGLDIFVLPSLAEGISNTLLEAMASGLPSVATRVGGNPELVDDDETGILVPPRDSGTLADALLRYVVDQDMLQRHGRAARARVESQFSLEAMVDKYVNVYDSVLQQD